MLSDTQANNRRLNVGEKKKKRFHLFQSGNKWKRLELDLEIFFTFFKNILIDFFFLGGIEFMFIIFVIYAFYYICYVSDDLFGNCNVVRVCVCALRRKKKCINPLWLLKTTFRDQILTVSFVSVAKRKVISSYICNINKLK